MNQATYFEAIRALPLLWITDFTRLVEYRGLLVAVNPLYSPMYYVPEAHKWEELQL